jgi:hypothetical protein
VLSTQDYLPHFTSFERVHRLFQQGQIEEPDFRLHARAFGSFLERLQQRLNWELPLLRGFSEAGLAIEMLIEPLQWLTGMVQSHPEQEMVLVNLQNCQHALHRVAYFFQQLPVFVDVAIVNELLILGSPEGEIDPLPVRHRLPLLLEWLGDLESDWKTFLTIHPQRQSLVDKALRIVQGLQGATGGIYLFLEGEDPDGLRNGLKLMVKALEALAPLEETRSLEEGQLQTLSPEFRLERAAQLIARLGSIPSTYERELLKWFSQKDLRMQEFRNYLWAECIEAPEAEQLSERLSELCTNLSNFLALDQFSLLSKLEQWRSDFEALEQKHRFQPPQASLA